MAEKMLGRKEREQLLKKEKPREYCKAIARIAPELNKKLKEQKEVSMPIEELANKMGPEFLTPRWMSLPPGGAIKYVSDPDELKTVFG